MSKKDKTMCCKNCYWYWGADTGCTFVMGVRIDIPSPSTTKCEHYRKEGQR